MAILHFFPDDTDPDGIVRRLVDALPSGSHVVVSHLARDVLDLDATYDRLNEATHETFVLRTHDEVSRFFAGLELLDPGVVLVDQWRPDPDARPTTGPCCPSTAAWPASPEAPGRAAAARPGSTDAAAVHQLGQELGELQAPGRRGRAPARPWPAGSRASCRCRSGRL